MYAGQVRLYSQTQRGRGLKWLTADGCNFLQTAINFVFLEENIPTRKKNYFLTG